MVIVGQPRLLTAGESIFLPRAIPYELMNVSAKPCRYILIGTPALFDRSIEEGATNSNRTKSWAHRQPRRSSVSARLHQGSASPCSRTGPGRGDAVVPWASRIS
ncbi:hypothetical protein [Rhizobium sp. LjRoot258]|uniref:hypothetical protein n=1 Tax=Rhizobium sp. LjRoot258 TaxID=3342299 RepID=UPI003F507AB0